jgi:hypothetical protein
MYIIVYRQAGNAARWKSLPSPLDWEASYAASRARSNCAMVDGTSRMICTNSGSSYAAFHLP